jgi:hypothetical protein
MNKFLITLATLVAFALSGVAHADAKLSGFLQQIVGMGDDIDGGVTEKFTRYSIGADTTIDNGWTVGGSFAMEVSAGTNSGYLPTQNIMYIQTDTMTVNIGAGIDAVTALVPRIGNMVPGGGHDAGYQFLFDGGLLGTGGSGVPFAEAYYAMANNRIHVSLPTMNGFSTAVSYTPAMEFNSSDGIGRTAHATADTSHGETASLGISYSGEMEGMSYTIGVGTHQGNSQGVNRRDDNVSTNNDLSSWAGAIQVTMGNIVMGIHGYDDGDSWGGSTDADKASNSGYTVSATYAMGNITVGVGYAHQERMRGTRAAQVAEAAGTAGQKREDSVTMFGIGYNMGGGVNTYVQLSSNDHSDGDHAVVTDIDPQVLFAGISLGF